MSFKEILSFINFNKRKILIVGIIFFILPIIAGTLISEAMIALAYAVVFSIGGKVIYFVNLVNVFIILIVIYMITLGIFLLSQLLINNSSFFKTNYVAFFRSNKKNIRKLFMIISLFFLSWIGIFVVIDNYSTKYFSLGMLVLLSIIFTYGIYIILSVAINKVWLKSGYPLNSEDKINKLALLKRFSFLFLMIINFIINYLFLKFYDVPILNGVIILLIVTIIIIEQSSIIGAKVNRE